MPESMQLASFAGIIIVSLAALAAGWNQIDDFLKRRAGKDGERVISPQPFEVKAAAEFVPKKDFEQHVRSNTERHGQLFHVIEVVKEEARKELKADTTALHEKINKVDREVGAIGEGMKFQNQQLASIQANLIDALRKT
jgi:hypothetical protein